MQARPSDGPGEYTQAFGLLERVYERLESM
jgi:hypothetical protein